MGKQEKRGNFASKRAGNRLVKAVWGFSVLMLVFGLALAGCENGAQEVEGTITANTQAPGVGLGEITAETNATGVRLSWDALVDVSEYKVSRQEEGKTELYKLTSGGPTLVEDTGKYVYNDIVSATNKLENGKSYKYTVIAIPYSPTVNTSKQEKTIAVPADAIVPQGTQVAKPTAVDFEFDAENNRIKVTVTPPTTGVVPVSYSVSVYRGSNQIGYQPTTINAPETTCDVTWNSYDQTTGNYTVRVTGNAGGGSYFKASDVLISAAKIYTYTAIFDSNANISASSGQAVLNGDTITSVSVPVSLSNIAAQTGVTYTFERAVIDANNNEGAWTQVTLKTQPSGGVNFAVPGIDLLGNPVSATAYDRDVPDGSYKYRVKASKAGNSDQYKTSYNAVKVNKSEFIAGSIGVSTAVDDNTNKTYTVTPSFTLIKGALPADGKLVIYWTTGGNYQSGYTSKITFTKAELEASPVSPKNIVVASSVYSFYAQAYIETPAGKQNVTEYGNFTWTTGDGVASTGNYWSQNNEQIYFVSLN